MQLENFPDKPSSPKREGVVVYKRFRLLGIARCMYLIDKTLASCVCVHLSTQIHGEAEIASEIWHRGFSPIFADLRERDFSNALAFTFD